MEFPVTINSQDEFDGLVKDRIKRAQERVSDQFADYAEVKAKAEAADAERERLEADLSAAVTRADAAEGKVTEFETERQINGWRTDVARASGVPAEALRGSTREEFEAHAQTLKPLITGSKSGPVIPNQGVEPAGSTVDNGTQAFADFLTGHRSD